MNLQDYLAEKCRVVDSALGEYLPSPDRFPQVIYEAMRYSVFNGGKRLRPTLVLAASEAVGGDPSLAMPTACAIECIHAFSLIHDDLPALDNDDLRRGKPTNHKVFGEAMAILAGDGLLTYAFEIIADRTQGVSPDITTQVIRKVASATGMSGMIVGQVADLLAEGKQLSIDDLRFIHRNKTGALIEVSNVCGAMLGGGTAEQIEALSLYGRKIGLAFQVVDDVLDIVGDEKKLGKPVGSDIGLEKCTYPSLFGLDKSKELARQAVDESITALSGFDERAEPLRAIARFIVERDY